MSQLPHTSPGGPEAAGAKMLNPAEMEAAVEEELEKEQAGKGAYRSGPPRAKACPCRNAEPQHAQPSSSVPPRSADVVLDEPVEGEARPPDAPRGRGGLIVALLAAVTVVTAFLYLAPGEVDPCGTCTHRRITTGVITEIASPLFGDRCYNMKTASKQLALGNGGPYDRAVGFWLGPWPALRCVYALLRMPTPR